jgi:hypothetical protein
MVIVSLKMTIFVVIGVAAVLMMMIIIIKMLILDVMIVLEVSKARPRGHVVVTLLAP